MNEATSERRKPGQIVNLTDAEHYKNWFGQIVATLVVGGIVAMMFVWSDTAILKRDVSRHEAALTTIHEDITEIKQGVARIEEAIKK